MIRDITLGQYYPADSILHKLDPRVKLVTTIAFLVALFVADDWVGYLVATVFLVAVIKLSRVPFHFMVKGLKAIFFILLITLIFNLFLTPGDVVLVQIWKLKITDKGLHTAIFIGCPADLPDSGHLCHDPDDYAQRPDGRSGEAVKPFEEAAGAGT